MALGVSLALSPFGCYKPAVSFLLTCILVTHVHLSLIQTVTCLTIVSHFTLRLFATFCLLSSLFINTLCLLHNFPCSHLITIVHKHLIHLSLYSFYICVLFALCRLLASCMLIQLCTLIVLCTLTALCIFTICTTIFVWGILVAHRTLLAHRCSLYYVQSQFNLTHHFIPIHLLFLDVHSLLYIALFHLCTLVTLFTFLVLFTLPALCALIAPLMLSPHSCSLLLHSDRSICTLSFISSCSIHMLPCTYTCCSCILLA